MEQGKQRLLFQLRVSLIVMVRYHSEGKIQHQADLAFVLKKKHSAKNNLTYTCSLVHY